MKSKYLALLPLLLISLSFSFSQQVKAADYICKWTQGETITIQSYPPTTTTSCPTQTSACSECTGTHPIDYICCKHSAPVVEPKKEPLFKLPDYVFQVPIGTLTKLTPINCLSGTCEVPYIAQYISAVYKYGLSVAGVFAVLILMAAGLLWMVSGGDSGKITTAKNLIFGSVTGLILLVGLVLFLSFINPDLANLKNISLPSIQRIEIEPEQDTDIALVGGVTVYKEGCDAARKGDLSVCRALGSVQPAGLVTVPGKNGNVKTDAAVYQKYQAAMECVKAKNGGKTLFIINESFRDATTQIKYWETKPKGSAATPCCSNHSSGQAMDVNLISGKMSWDYNESSGLTACMNAQGLYAKITTGGKDGKGEPWHWSPTGK
jgi:hypothetical protein